MRKQTECTLAQLIAAIEDIHNSNDGVNSDTPVHVMLGDEREGEVLACRIHMVSLGIRHEVGDEIRLAGGENLHIGIFAVPFAQGSHFDSPGVRIHEIAPDGSVGPELGAN